MPRRPSPGITLFELVIALALVTALGTLAAPIARRVRDWGAVEQAATDIMTAHWSARALAVHTGRFTALRVRRDAVEIRVLGAGRDSLWQRRPGPSARGVDLVASREEVAFTPTGIGWGAANTTIRLTRGQATAVLVTSRLGRLRRLE